MRLLVGLILGALLTVGGAYIYDSRHALDATNPSASLERPLVNWDVATRSRISPARDGPGIR